MENPCSDCRYRVKRHWIDWLFGISPRCEEPRVKNAKNRNIEYGEKLPLGGDSIRYQRSHEEWCGPEGKFFRAKPGE